MKASFKTGVIALAFLILGFQLALFVHKAAVVRIVANHDTPDTVFVYCEERLTDASPPEEVSLRSTPPSGAGPLPLMVPRVAQLSGLNAPASEPFRNSNKEKARRIYEQAPGRRTESFNFDPNTVSQSDLQRLGFSEKQALSIIAYRDKGGRFRRKSDFAKSYVVADSVYRRLEPYIHIPKIDINKADSAAFDTLPGIGGWFAAKMVEYRTQLRGYSNPEQLMEIYRFDAEKYDGLKDLICCSPAEPYPFWSGSLDDIRSHPHIRRYDTAKAIILYRENTPAEDHTVQGLLDAGIISEEQAARLALCNLK